jgi:hypothetical protein
MYTSCTSSNSNSNTDNVSAQQAQPNTSSKDNMAPAQQPNRNNSTTGRPRNSVQSFKTTANVYGEGTNSQSPHLTRKKALVPKSGDSPTSVSSEKNIGLQQRPAFLRSQPASRGITAQRTDSLNSTNTISSAETQPTSNKNLESSHPNPENFEAGIDESKVESLPNRVRNPTQTKNLFTQSPVRKTDKEWPERPLTPKEIALQGMAREPAFDKNGIPIDVNNSISKNDISLPPMQSRSSLTTNKVVGRTESIRGQETLNGNQGGIVNDAMVHSMKEFTKNSKSL